MDSLTGKKIDLKFNNQLKIYEGEQLPNETKVWWGLRILDSIYYTPEPMIIRSKNE